MAKILVVDDDPSVVEMLTFILTRKKYTVVCAHDGKEGLAVAKREKPDLIILDIMMPVMDGLSVSGILFQDPVLRLTPVLILTAKESAQHMFTLLPNVRLYMTKPFDPHDLCQNILRLLGMPLAPVEPSSPKRAKRKPQKRQRA